jgi:hypothetical protein
MLGNVNTDWYIFDVFIPVSPGQKLSSLTAAPPVQRGKYTAAKDTLLFSKTYKKYYQMYMMPAFPLNIHVGYLREDTANRKVYFMDKTTFVEELLYDFSMNVGDSIFMNFPGTFAPFPKGYYKVKSIQNVTIKAGVRKLFKLKLNPGTSDTLRIIESVGSEIHPVFMYNMFFAPGQFAWAFGACKYPYALGVACKYADNIKEYQSCTYQLTATNTCIFKSDSCNYWNTCSGINELSKVKDLHIAPNPAVTKVKISIDLEEACSPVFEIYDVSGRKVRSLPIEKLHAGINQIEFDITELQNGMYFIKAKDENFVLSYPLIIAH